jgi:transposase
MTGRYDAKFKQRAVRLLADSLANYTSETKALEGVAKDLGIAMDCGESKELRKLRREHAELRRANEIVSSASAFSPQGSTRHGVD